MDHQLASRSMDHPSQWASDDRHTHSETRRADGGGNTVKLKKLHGKSIVALTLLACLSALCCLTWNSGSMSDVEGNDSYHQQQASRALLTTDDFFEKPATICGRATGSAPWTVATNLTATQREKIATCPEFSRNKKTLIIDGYQSYGRTGNHIRAFLYAVQYTHDHDYQLGITYKSWAMNLLTSMFMVQGEDKDVWIPRMEKALCIKVFESKIESYAWNRVKNPSYLAKNLFYYHTFAPEEEFEATQLYTTQKLFQYYNTGGGIDARGNEVRDMCSGINAVFGKEDHTSVIYSVIHLRKLEEFGKGLLAHMARGSGCDPEAALEMEPDYVKSILGPLGMLEHPIVVITDNQDPLALVKLLRDPDIGPNLRVVRSGDSWYGGDTTLAIMANVFIGNPASTMTGFAARSRIALGFGGSNYIFRAKDENGAWTTVCGDECLFGKRKGNVFIHQGWAQSISHVNPPALDEEQKTRVQSTINKFMGRDPEDETDPSARTLSQPKDKGDLGTNGVRRKVYLGLHPDDLKRGIILRQERRIQEEMTSKRP